MKSINNFDAYTILVSRCGLLILKKRPSFALSHSRGNLMGTLTQGFELLLCGWCQLRYFCA